MTSKNTMSDSDKPTPGGQTSEQILERVRELNLMPLVTKVAGKCNCTALEILSGSRSSRVSAGRVHLYKALRDLGWSYADIGKLVDRTHSTIVIAINGRSRLPKKVVAPSNNG